MWVWRGENRTDAILLTECPASYKTPESERWISLFLACRSLGAPPQTGGVLEWPARTVDAFLLLEEESTDYTDKHASISRPESRTP